MRPVKRLLIPLLLSAAAAFAQQQIDPTSQINWPLATGTGAPTLACTSANYGQPYSNLAPNPAVVYVCTANGWQNTNLSSEYAVNGDGVDDTSAALQAQINLCPANATCTYSLSNVVLANTVMVPSTSQFRFTCTAGPATTNTETSGGCVQITAAAGFERTGGNPALPLPYRWGFTGMKISKSTAGPAIWDNLTFASGGNQGLDLNGNTFTLSNGAYGVQTIGAQMNNFIGNTFIMGFGALTTGTASSGSTSLTVASSFGILAGMTVTGTGIAAGTTVSAISGDTVTLSVATTAALSGTQVTFGNNCTTCYAIVPDMAVGNYGSQTANVVGNQFYFGNVIGYPNISSTTCPYGWQGWTFDANQVIGSLFSVKCGNTINLYNNQFVDTEMVLDSVYGSAVTRNYFNGPNGTALLTLTNTYHNTIQATISENFFEMDPGENMEGIEFLAGGNATQNTNIYGNQYQGPSNSGTNPVYGIVFDDPNLTGTYIHGDSYLQLYSVFNFEANQTYGLIENFNAAQVANFALGTTTYWAPTSTDLHNVGDPIYKVFYDVAMQGYLPASPTAAEVLSSGQLTFATMPDPNPEVSVSSSGLTCTSGWSVGFGPPWSSTSPYAYGDMVNLALNVAASTAAGYGGCQATIVVNGSAYTP